MLFVTDRTGRDRHASLQARAGCHSPAAGQSGTGGHGEERGGRGRAARELDEDLLEVSLDLSDCDDAVGHQGHPRTDRSLV